MHIPEYFKINDKEIIKRFIKTYPFATVISKETGDITHIPLVMRDDATLEGHFAIQNPHAKAIAENPQAITVFQGPHAYISPTMYDQTKEAVPTWNYAVVHVHGKMTLFHEEIQLRSHLELLADTFERKRNPKWELSDVSERFLSSLSQGIVGFSFKIERIEAKFKLGQNRSASDKQGMIVALKQDENLAYQEMGAFMSSYFGK